MSRAVKKLGLALGSQPGLSHLTFQKPNTGPVGPKGRDAAEWGRLGICWVESLAPRSPVPLLAKVSPVTST
jgi:hypothetical protein